MLNNNQIKLVQTAAKAAGLRTATFDGRYRFLLSQYTQSNSHPVTSCKQLTNYQLDDFLAICEAHGWVCPGKCGNYYCFKVSQQSEYASFAQQSAIRKLAEDLGWDINHLNNFIARMTLKSENRTSNITQLKPEDAFHIIEALKSILSRATGKKYSSLKEVQKDMELATDGTKQS